MKDPLSNESHENKKKAIFILDDREDVRDSIFNLLDTIGVQAFVSDTSESAFSILDKHHEIIKNAFIDQRLEGETGIKFIEQAKQRYPEVSFILLTAWPLNKKEKLKLQKLKVPYKDKISFNSNELVEDFSNYEKHEKRMKSELERIGVGLIPGETQEKVFQQSIAQEHQMNHSG